MQDRAGWSSQAGPLRLDRSVQWFHVAKRLPSLALQRLLPRVLEYVAAFCVKLVDRRSLKPSIPLISCATFIHSFSAIHWILATGCTEGLAMLRPACEPRVTPPVIGAERAMRGRRPQSLADSRGHCVCDAGGVRGSRGCRLGRKLRALGRVWTTDVWDGQEGHCVIQAKAGGQAVCEGQRAWRDGAEGEVQEDPCLGPESQECVWGAELRWKDRCPVWALGGWGRAGSGGSSV